MGNDAGLIVNQGVRQLTYSWIAKSVAKLFSVAISLPRIYDTGTNEKNNCTHSRTLGDAIELGAI